MLGRAASKTWKEFARGTSIHGFKYSTSRRLIDRILWFTLPVLSILTAMYLMLLMFQRYKKDPTKTVYESQFVPVALQTFSAVTICAPRKFTSKNLNKLISNTIVPKNITESDLKASLQKLIGFTVSLNVDNTSLAILNHYFQVNNINAVQVIDELMPKCEDILTKCRWEGRDQRCIELFRRSTIIYGICCSFNYNYDTEEMDYPSMTSKYFGPQMGLSVVIDPSTEYNNQVYHIMDTFKIILHKVHSYAGRDNTEIYLPLKSEIHMSFTPTVTISDSSIYSMTPEDRGCYLENDAKLRHFKKYSKGDCLLECEIRMCIKRCSCQPYMYPHIDGDVICQVNAIPCLVDHFNFLKTSGWDKTCNCPAQCNDEEARTEINTIPLQGTIFNPDTLYNQLNGNQSLLNVYYYQGSSTIIRRTVSSYWVDLVSNFGGVFNLFVGCSFLSILEMFYYAIVKFARNIRE